MNETNLKLHRKKKLICDPARLGWEFAEIKSSITQINNNNLHIFLMGINMKIIIEIERIMYLGCKNDRKKIEDLFLGVNLELLFNLYNTLLHPMLILSLHKS